MANIEGKKTDGDKCWLARMGSNKNSHLVLMDMQNSRALLENSLSVSYKVKHRLTYDPRAFFNLDISPSDLKIYLTKKNKTNKKTPCTSIMTLTVALPNPGIYIVLYYTVSILYMRNEVKLLRHV